MFDSSKTITRIAGGLDLLIDVATLGEYGLEEAADATVAETVRDRHAARSHTSFNPQPRSSRERCEKPARRRSNVVELDRFLRPQAPAAVTETAGRGPKVAGHATTLAPVIPINAEVAAGSAIPVAARVAERQSCPEAAPDYRPCTAAARRLGLTAA
jgi:hypothetical protein